MKECIFPSPTRAYELPWEIKSIWSAIFGAMLFVAITGNTIVLWIVLGKYISETFVHKQFHFALHIPYKIKLCILKGYTIVFYSQIRDKRCEEHYQPIVLIWLYSSR